MTGSPEPSHPSQGSLLSAFLHELRLPLSLVAGFADILRETVLEAHQAEALNGILDHCSHLQDLVHDYAELVRLDAGLPLPVAEAVHTVAAISELVADQQARAGGQGMTVRTTWSSFVPDAIEVAPAVLRRIVQAAILHVQRRSRSGPVQVSVSYRDRGDGDAPAALCVRVSAADAGPVPRDQDIGAFAVRDAVGRPELGMAVAQTLLGLIGGRLQVQPDGGRGLAVALAIPAPAVANAPWVDPLRVPESGRGVKAALPKGTRLLVAEDVRDNQLLLRHVLEKAGAVVDMVERGDLAVQRVLAAERAGEPYDALVTDLMMPILNGHEAVRILRQQGCRLPIVAMTSRSETADEAMCLGVGCDAFLRKPVRREILLRTLARCLQGRPLPAAPVAS